MRLNMVLDESKSKGAFSESCMNFVIILLFRGSGHTIKIDFTYIFYVRVDRIHV